jgi:hypothetical protein
MQFITIYFRLNVTKEENKKIIHLIVWSIGKAGGIHLVLTLAARETFPD